jgi:hypothetical protein
MSILLIRSLYSVAVANATDFKRYMLHPFSGSKRMCKFCVSFWPTDLPTMGLLDQESTLQTSRLCK